MLDLFCKTITIILLILISSCKPVQDMVWKQPSTINGFLKNLAAEYYDFGQTLRELDYNQAADIILNKARIAKMGTAPAPQAATTAELQQAYQRLLKALDERPKRIVASTAARAQLLYDCQALPVELPDEIIDNCKQEFYAALEILETVISNLVPRYQNSIYFNTTNAALSATGYKQIGHITSQLLSMENYNITVIGHSAPSNNPKKDWDIALQRAKRVEEALQEAGVPAQRIKTISLGSSVPLPNITDEKRLNRVDIKIHLEQPHNNLDYIK